jgi:hypothetical protein
MYKEVQRMRYKELCKARNELSLDSQRAQIMMFANFQDSLDPVEVRREGGAGKARHVLACCAGLCT